MSAAPPVAPVAEIAPTAPAPAPHDAVPAPDLHREASINLMMLLAAAERAFDARQFEVAAGKLSTAEAVVARVSAGSRG
jgi:hypothetical protein